MGSQMGYKGANGPLIDLKLGDQQLEAQFFVMPSNDIDFLSMVLNVKEKD